MNTTKRECIGWLFLLLMVLLPAVPAGAQVITAQNGLPVIDLSPYSVFDVTFKKIQVADADKPTTMAWADAVAECAKTSGWRLPTLGELRFIFALHPQLVKRQAEWTAFKAFAVAYYWSSTEYSADVAWNVRFSDGYVINNDKASGYSCRCVRDV